MKAQKMTFTPSLSFLPLFVFMLHIITNLPRCMAVCQPPLRPRSAALDPFDPIDRYLTIHIRAIYLLSPSRGLRGRKSPFERRSVQPSKSRTRSSVLYCFLMKAENRRACLLHPCLHEQSARYAFLFLREGDESPFRFAATFCKTPILYQNLPFGCEKIQSPCDIFTLP